MAYNTTIEKYSNLLVISAIQCRLLTNNQAWETHIIFWEATNKINVFVWFWFVAQVDGGSILGHPIIFDRSFCALRFEFIQPLLRPVAFKQIQYHQNCYYFSRTCVNIVSICDYDTATTSWLTTHDTNAIHAETLNQSINSSTPKKRIGQGEHFIKTKANSKRVPLARRVGHCL